MRPIATDISQLIRPMSRIVSQGKTKAGNANVKGLLASVIVICAGVPAQAGFGDALDKVQKTVETVKAVGEVIDSTRNANAQTVTGFETIATLANLESLDIQKIPGVTSIASLTACKKLKDLVVSKGVFPTSETDALDAIIKTNNKYGKVRLYYLG